MCVATLLRLASCCRSYRARQAGDSRGDESITEQRSRADRPRPRQRPRVSVWPSGLYTLQ